MWLITKVGFFSVVQKEGETTLTVRSRVREDLEALRDLYLPSLGEIREGIGTDYPCRANVGREELAAAMSRMVEDLTYANFKDEVARRQGHDRAFLYSEVWSTLRQLEHRYRKFGGVLLREDGRILLREPTNHYDGYVWTFAKGGPRAGENPQETALREVLEETGWESEITGVLAGTFGSGDTQYFLMRPVRDHGDFRRNETASIRWATLAEARVLLSQTRKASGRERDLAVLEAVEKHVAREW